MTDRWTTDQITAHATSLRTTHGDNIDALTIAETADDHGINSDGWKGSDWDAYIEAVEEILSTPGLTDQPLDLDAIEARANTATPGPWAVSEDYSDVLAPDGSQLASYWNPTSETENGEFIAHAREDVPALLAEVRRLRAQVAAVTDLCDQQEMAARMFELPTPEWITAVRGATAPAARSAAV